MSLSDVELAAFKARMPLAFRAAPEVRLRRTLVWTALAHLTAWCLCAFDFSPARIWKGLGRLGTVLAALVAFAPSFLSARNINRVPLLRFTLRCGFDMIRALQTLTLPFVFIRAFGLGPLACVLAIAEGEVGVLAILCTQAIENT